MQFPPNRHPHRRTLAIAAAVLLPVPLAVAGPLNFDHTSSIQQQTTGRTGALALAAIEPTPAPPYTTSAAASTDASKPAQRASRAGDRKLENRAVIKKSVHERIEEISANTTYDVPLAALEAYHAAAASVASASPSCGLSWGVVAAIGQVESGHGRFGGASVLADGTTTPLILGVPLNGHGVARIPDTDNGAFDHDLVWDRAVGPMQFIPSTWVGLGADGDGDGSRNPSDFDDAALATARYLCSGGGDMRILAQARGAVLRYNHSEEYVDLVLQLANAYDSGVVDVVPNDTAPPQPRTRPHHPHRQPSPAPERSPASKRHASKPVRHAPSPSPSPKPSPSPTPSPSPKPSPSPTPSPSPKPSPSPTPSPSPKPSPSPPPKPSPSPSPSPAPQPAPAPDPIVKTLDGLLQVCAIDSTKFCVGRVMLRLSPMLTGTDYDDDGTIESAVAELRGVVERAGVVTVTTTDGVITEFAVVSLVPLIIGTIPTTVPPIPVTPSPTLSSETAPTPSGG